MQHSIYHKMVRVAFLTTALVLVFDSGMALPVTRHLSDNTWNYLANSTSVVARVEPNELNVLTAELTAQKAELDAREAALREIEARSFENPNTPNYSTYILSIILAILTALIITNYILDWRRARFMSPV